MEEVTGWKVILRFLGWFILFWTCFNFGYAFGLAISPIYFVLLIPAGIALVYGIPLGYNLLVGRDR